MPTLSSHPHATHIRFSDSSPEGTAPQRSQTLALAGGGDHAFCKSAVWYNNSRIWTDRDYAGVSPVLTESIRPLAFRTPRAVDLAVTNEDKRHSMKSYLQTGLVVMAGVFGAATATADIDHDTIPIHRNLHARASLLQRFFQANDAPAESAAEAFVLEADEHHLDWRLLPSLAFVESGGGKRNRRNNMFGWNNGESRFATAREAIHHVAQALSEAHAYKGKDLKGKLAVYNRTPGYRKMVTDVMLQISAVLDPGKMVGPGRFQAQTR